MYMAADEGNGPTCVENTAIYIHLLPLHLLPILDLWLIFDHLAANEPRTSGSK